MTDNITNKDYITITDDKVMVGGKPTKTYLGEKINIPKDFREVQAIMNKEHDIVPIEMHVLASNSSEKPSVIRNGAILDNIRHAHNLNVWFRFVFKNNIKTSWVLTPLSTSVFDCAYYCVYDLRRKDKGCYDLLSMAMASVADVIKPKDDTNLGNIIKPYYITITNTKVMLGDAPTTRYWDEDIWKADQLPERFKQIQYIVKQEYGVAPIEMHVLSSSTEGQYAKPGNPSSKHGRNAWARLVFENDVKTPWVFRHSYVSGRACAIYCAGNWCSNVQGKHDLRSSLCDTVADVIKQQDATKSKNIKADIANTDYITITDDKVMVGGKETTKYRGCDIWHMETLPSLFKGIQTKVKQEYGTAPIEMRVLSSKTSGQYAKPGTPSPKHGKNAWVSFVFANGIETRWVFKRSYSSASDCAVSCARACGSNVRDGSAFRSGIFGPHADAIKQQLQQTEKTNATELADKATKWQNLLLHNLVSERFAH